MTFKSGVQDPRGFAKQLARQNGGTLTHSYDKVIKGFAAKLSAQAVTALGGNPNIESIEPVQIISAAGVASSGTETPVVGGLDRIDQRSPVLDNSYTWSSDGAGVVVYVLDTGVRITHQEFAGRASYGPDFVANASSNDCNGHGTHVAGTIGGTVYGVAKNVSLSSVRVLDCAGQGTTSTVLAGLDWVAANHAPLSVANLSFSAGLSAVLNQAVTNLVTAGVTVVAAAGEQGAPPDSCVYSPGSASAAITVGGSRSTATGDEVGLSNGGSCIDLFAPGWSVVSSWYTGDTVLWMLSGTSMAAAHVSGAAAMYLSNHPGATPAQVADSLISNATTGTLNLSATYLQTSPNRLLYVGDPTAPNPAPAPSPSPSPTPTAAPTPTNVAPVASFTASCSRASCSFNASASTDDHGISTYAWSFGDGTSSSGASPLASHVYSGKGTYSETVTLTVTDASGLSSSSQKILSIKNKGK